MWMKEFEAETLLLTSSSKRRHFSLQAPLRKWLVFHTVCTGSFSSLSPWWLKTIETWHTFYRQIEHVHEEVSCWKFIFFTKAIFFNFNHFPLPAPHKILTSLRVLNGFKWNYTYISKAYWTCAWRRLVLKFYLFTYFLFISKKRLFKLSLFSGKDLGFLKIGSVLSRVFSLKGFVRKSAATDLFKQHYSWQTRKWICTSNVDF